ncbi:hypothetical protein ACIRPQ_32605 [Streptomyces sp. NPDC101213]|uniref:hypothetical protein n=1 Tax=Streptomyces sp. NPDC101213 TaxID=3366130 RepID=UPI00381D1312
MRARAGHLDTLVDNGGILGEVTASEDTTADQIRHVYGTSVFGLVRVCRLMTLVPRCQARRA